MLDPLKIKNMLFNASIKAANNCFFILIDKTSVITKAGLAPTTESLVITPVVGPEILGLFINVVPPHCAVANVLASKLQYQIFCPKDVSIVVEAAVEVVVVASAVVLVVTVMVEVVAVEVVAVVVVSNEIDESGVLVDTKI